ncbi:unnamed protein product [Rotaria magnacalcarata]
MIKTLILLIASIAVIEGSYSCPQSNGTFQNDDDYRSYHACTNYCDRVTYCLQTNEYYSAIERTCKRDEFNWLPGYDLTGTQLIMPLVQYRHFQQSRYDVYWTSETLNHQFDFMGRYINETHVIGTETILSLRTKCVFVRNVQLLVRGPRSFCATNIPNAYSMKCKLPPHYNFSGYIDISHFEPFCVFIFSISNQTI